MVVFNNILRGIIAINDCLGLACKQTIFATSGISLDIIRLQVAV